MYRVGAGLLFACLLGVIACAGNQADTPTFLSGSFTTKGLLPIDLVSPINAETVNSRSASFAWTERVPNYVLEIARDAQFQNLVLQKRATSANYTLQTTDLIGGQQLASGNYYWRVQIANVENNLRSKTGSFFLQVVPEPGSTIAGGVYVNKASASTQQNGGRQSPYKSIQSAIAAADALRNGDRNIPFDIYVAQATYNEDILIPAGIRVLGGYNASLLDSNGEWSRNASTYVTTITGLGARTVRFFSDVTADYRNQTGIDGFTINAAGGAESFAIYLLSASPSISNLIINTGNASNRNGAIFATSSSAPHIFGNRIVVANGGIEGRGIELQGGSNARIERNTISIRGSFACIGIIALQQTNILVANNVVLVGACTFYEVIAVQMTNSTGNIAGNTIYAGSNTGSSGNIGIQLQAGTSLSIQNNIISTTPTSGGTRACIEETASVAMPAVTNNNLFGCPVLYVDFNNGCGGGTNCSLAQLNALAGAGDNMTQDNAGGVLFVNEAGADGNINLTADNDVRLTTGTSAGVCNVRSGGQNLTSIFSIDRLSNARSITNAPGCSPTLGGAGGFSIGAYESD